MNAILKAKLCIARLTEWHKNYVGLIYAESDQFRVGVLSQCSRKKDDSLKKNSLLPVLL